ncbi:hypothetical protein GS440_05055 [Rhodococcus hoagii]|nr:hypothetical protein [Prescottella equi]MBU4614744.1 hypothetical protein [Rhodococcus sp. GG48]
MTTFSESHSGREVDAFPITLLGNGFSRCASRTADTACRCSNVARASVGSTVHVTEPTDLPQPEVRREGRLRVGRRAVRGAVDNSDKRFRERGELEVVRLRMPQQLVRRLVGVTSIEDSHYLQRAGTDSSGSVVPQSDWRRTVDIRRRDEIVVHGTSFVVVARPSLRQHISAPLRL